MYTVTEVLIQPV